MFRTRVERSVRQYKNPVFFSYSTSRSQSVACVSKAMQGTLVLGSNWINLAPNLEASEIRHVTCETLNQHRAWIRLVCAMIDKTFARLLVVFKFMSCSRKESYLSTHPTTTQPISFLFGSVSGQSRFFIPLHLHLCHGAVGRASCWPEDLVNGCATCFVVHRMLTDCLHVHLGRIEIKSCRH